MMLGLENMTELLRRIGDPQNSFRSIHIAGSDGKGSTCAMLHSIIKAAGNSVGMYTSPHILDLKERIVVNGREIDDNDVESLVIKIRPAVEEMAAKGEKCTFFEVMTAMAFLHFSEQKVEYAVVETGLGGRFDATNVLSPVLSIITNISLEHTSILGDTIEKIAFEKAGIIKPGVPVITANPSPALDVISKIAKERGSKLIVVHRDNISNVMVEESHTSMEYRGKGYDVGIPGRYQAENAAVVIEAVIALDNAKMEKYIKAGLKDVRWGARMERIGDFIVDVTHTSAGAAALADDIGRIYGKVVLVFGILNDKDLDNIAKELSRIASKVIVTTPDSERAADLSVIKNIVSKYHSDVHIAVTVGDAMDEAFRMRKEGELILVTGSFFMAGDAERWLKKIYAGS